MDGEGGAALSVFMSQVMMKGYLNSIRFCNALHPPKPSGRKIRRFKVRGPTLKLPAAHQLTPQQKETTTSPSRPLEHKTRRFKVREPPQ